MCGIAGMIKLNNENVNPSVIKKMTDVISHRGPDGEGIWINESKNAGFGHRRLSIIDLSESAAQPMHYLNNRYTIVYNGEIYNYIEIKEILLKKGYTFKSQSDTEVLLALFHDKRHLALQDLDGMFAFAIWDNVEQELFCARDRFGEKPFFYYSDKESFCFASEVKALFAGGVKKEIVLDKVQQYIDSAANEYPIETYFRNIFKLEQSHYLILKNNVVTVHKYFDLTINTTTRYKTLNEYAEHFNELFTTSIKRRLRSDVPIGTSLSGGLDSSSVACYINKFLENRVNQKTFSARFHDIKNDEGKWIDHVIERTGVENHSVFPNPANSCIDINKMIWSHETPLGSTSNCVQFYVMQLAKSKNVTVILDGQGADEYLAGYDRYIQHAHWEYFYNLQFYKFFSERKTYKNRYGKNIPLGYLFIPKVLISRIFMSGNTNNKYYQSLKSKLLNDLKYTLPELLAYADRNSMIHSVETRLPFLYHELVQFVLSCPNEVIFNKATTKVILREAIRNTVPDKIVDRADKLNYNARQELWLHYFEIPKKFALENFDLKQGSNYWRNYSASKFIEVFSS